MEQGESKTTKWTQQYSAWKKDQKPLRFNRVIAYSSMRDEKLSKMAKSNVSVRPLLSI